MFYTAFKCLTISGFILFLSVSCNRDHNHAQQNGDSKASSESIRHTDSNVTAAAAPTLPAPYATESKAKFCKVIGWPEGKMPTAPAGFTVSKYADKLLNPRWIYVAANNDVFVAEANTEATGLSKAKAIISGKAKSQNLGPSGNRITLFRDTNNDGIPDERYVLLDNMNKPFGMLVLNNFFYVANTDGLWQYPYKPGENEITKEGRKILDLPAGGYNNHWTRNLIASEDGNKIYVSVGSASNVAEHGMEEEIRRAGILEINPDGTGETIYAAGLRNPVGMDWQPGTQTLWTAVNERDELGDDLVPDYLTSVKRGGFYGWPYSYYGQNLDPRIKEKEQKLELVKNAIVPEVPLGAHTASLGLTFYDQDAFPAKYKYGAFVGQHGSWNRSTLVGYKVVFVPFNETAPTTKYEDFLTGFFADESKGEVYGRPVAVVTHADGSLLVADDAGNTVWRVSYKK